MLIIIATAKHSMFLRILDVYLTNANALLGTVFFCQTTQNRHWKKKVYNFTRKTARVSNIG